MNEEHQVLDGLVTSVNGREFAVVMPVLGFFCGKLIHAQCFGDRKRMERLVLKFCQVVAKAASHEFEAAKSKS